MLVVGLTGGIASGKSSVSQYLREMGADIIDADELARELVQPHSPALQEITGHFGNNIVDEEGNLKRKLLGEIIFRNPGEREVLNGILHPLILKRVEDIIALYRRKKDNSIAIVDAPLLIEAGMTSMVDEIWVVAIPEEVQIQRLMERDNISREEAQKRLESQMPLSQKLRYADRIIDNSGKIEATKEKLRSIWKEIINQKKL